MCPAGSADHPLSTHNVPRTLPLNHTVRLVRLVLSCLFSHKETEAQTCEATGPSSCGLKIESDSQTWTLAAVQHHPQPREMALALVGDVGSTYLLDEIHEAAAKAPSLVPVALKGVHGHLGRPLVAHRHDVDSVIQ